MIPETHKVDSFIFSMQKEQLRRKSARFSCRPDKKISRFNWNLLLRNSWKLHCGTLSRRINRWRGWILFKHKMDRNLLNRLDEFEPQNALLCSARNPLFWETDFLDFILICVLGTCRHSCQRCCPGLWDCVNFDFGFQRHKFALVWSFHTQFPTISTPQLHSSNSQTGWMYHLSLATLS